MMKWSPFKYLTPVEFPDVDCRFYHVKFDRISVCDQYADIVRFRKLARTRGVESSASLQKTMFLKRLRLLTEGGGVKEEAY